MPQLLWAWVQNCARWHFCTCFHSNVSVAPEAATSTRPQCITPRTCYWDQCPTPAPLKSSTVKSNRESRFVVKAWLSPWAAGLGERLSEIPAAPVKLVTLRLCKKTDLELWNVVLLLLFAYSWIKIFKKLCGWKKKERKHEEIGRDIIIYCMWDLEGRAARWLYDFSFE